MLYFESDSVTDATFGMECSSGSTRASVSQGHSIDSAERKSHRSGVETWSVGSTDQPQGHAAWLAGPLTSCAFSPSRKLTQRRKSGSHTATEAYVPIQNLGDAGGWFDSKLRQWPAGDEVDSEDCAADLGGNLSVLRENSSISSLVGGRGSRASGSFPSSHGDSICRRFGPADGHVINEVMRLMQLTEELFVTEHDSHAGCGHRSSSDDAFLAAAADDTAMKPSGFHPIARLAARAKCSQATTSLLWATTYGGESNGKHCTDARSDDDANIEDLDVQDKFVVLVGPKFGSVVPDVLREMATGPQLETLNSLKSKPRVVYLSDVVLLQHARPQPAVLSFGSACHRFTSCDQFCRPCMYERLPGRCKRSVLCDFCHLHGRVRVGNADAPRRNQKQVQNAMKWPQLTLRGDARLEL